MLKYMIDLGENHIICKFCLQKWHYSPTTIYENNSLSFFPLFLPRGMGL